MKPRLWFGFRQWVLVCSVLQFCLIFLKEVTRGQMTLLLRPTSQVPRGPSHPHLPPGLAQRLWECTLVWPVWKTVHKFLVNILLPYEQGYPGGAAGKEPTRCGFDS